MTSLESSILAYPALYIYIYTHCSIAITESIQQAAKGKQSSCNVPSKKRALTPEPFGAETFDAENVDPSFFSPKRAKAMDGRPKLPAYSITTSVMGPPALKPAMAPPSASPKLGPPFVPRAKGYQSFAPSFVLPGGLTTGPGGRSPSKRTGPLANKSRITRVNPPSFGESSDALPISIAQALAGSLVPAAPNRPTLKPVLKPKRITKSWKFAVWEDTSAQEAQNLMEHCAGILDISDEDARGSSKKNDRGKENIAPADYVVPNPMSLRHTKGGLKVRRSGHADAMVEVGEQRAPLGALPAAEFYGQGLGAGSIAFVPVDNEELLQVEAPAADDVAARVNLLLASIQMPSVKTAAGFTIACDDDEEL